MKPEMSAFEVTERVLEAVSADKYDLIVLNFANADMVGHTGVMDAAVKAIEALDKCVPRIVDAVLAAGGQILLTADHGNADEMLDADGNVLTAHSLNEVPLVNISEDALPLCDGGRLCDIAPTLLELMGLEQPDEMTGHSLLCQGNSGNLTYIPQRGEKMNILEAKETIIRAGKELTEIGFLSRTFGNISCRINSNNSYYRDGSFAITPSGKNYLKLSPDEIVEMSLTDYNYDKNFRPSMEYRLHGEVYRMHPDANFVIYTTQANASAVSPWV